MTGPDRPLSVAHVVVTDAFAGVERYVCQVAGELAGRGHRVLTVGGDQLRMRAELPAASTRPGRPDSWCRRPGRWPPTTPSTSSTPT